MANKIKSLLTILLGIVIAISFILNAIFIVDYFSGNQCQRLFENSIYSIVELKAQADSIGESFGTAEFIDNNGTLVTNAHVVTYKKLGVYTTFENFSIRFSTSEDYIPVELIKYDTDLDIAILKLNDTNIKFKALKLGDSSKIKHGNEIIAIGNLNNKGISVTKGIISNPDIVVEYDNVSRQVIQCDLTIADGNSGGALLDMNGNLLGITTFRLKDNLGNVIYGIAYCIPVNTISEYLKNGG